MSDLLKNVDFLKDLPFRVLILHVTLIYSLDCHVLSCQHVDAKGHLTKGTFTYQLHEFVIVKGGRRYFIILFYESSYELDYLVSFI